MNWLQTLIEWIKTKLFGFNTDSIEIDTNGNIKSVKINFYFEGKGWSVKDLILFNDDTHKFLVVGDVSNDKNQPTEKELTDSFIDFNNDSNLKISCNFTCNDGEVIHIKNIGLKINKEHLSLDQTTNKILYKLTPTILNLHPITFGNPTIHDYITAEIL